MTKIKYLIKKYRRFLKYILISIFTSIINVLLYIVIENIFKEMYIFANILSWLISTFIIFILNKKVIFKVESKITFKEVIYFYILRLSSLLLDTIVLKFCITYIKMNYIVAKIISNSVTIFNNYFISKYYIFK